MIQELDRTASATANAMGSATFTFDLVPISQTWLGTVNIPLAPDTAVSFIQDPSTQKGAMIGSNSWGPTRLAAGEQLAVITTGLVPGSVYECNLIGTCYTEQEAPDTWPAAYADAVTTSTDNIFLGQGSTTGSNFTSVTIPGNPRWRSIWCVAQSGTGSTDTQLSVGLQGLQSGTNYEAFLPPYFNPATDGFYAFRFAVLPGVDTTYHLTVGSGAGSGAFFWYGADLANIDVAIYPDGSTALPVGGLVTSSPTAPGPGYMTLLDVSQEAGLQAASVVGLAAGQILALCPPLQNQNTVGGFLYRLVSYYRRLTGTLAANKGVVFGQTPTNGTWANGATAAFASTANVVVACPPSSIVSQVGSEWTASPVGTPYVVVGGTGGSVTVLNMAQLPVTSSTITVTGLTATTKLLWDGVRYVFGLGTISGNVSVFVLDLLTLTLSGTLTVAGATDICLSPNISNGGLLSQGIFLYIATTTSNQIQRTTHALGSTTTMTGGSAGTGYNHIATDGVNVYALSTGTTWSVDTWAAQSPFAFVRNTAGVAGAAAATIIYFTGQIITGNRPGAILVGYQASGTSFPTVRAFGSGGVTVSTTTIVSTIGSVNTIACATPAGTAYVTTSGVLSSYPLNYNTGVVGTAIATAINPATATSTGTGWILYTAAASVTTQVLTASTNTVATVSVTDSVGASCYDPFTGTFVAVQAGVGYNTIVSTGLGQENDALLDASTTQPGPTTSLKNGRLVAAVYVQNTYATAGATNVEVSFDVVLTPVVA